MEGRKGLPFQDAEGACSGSGQDVGQLRILFRDVILPELQPALRTMMREEMQNVLSGCTYPSLRMPSNQNQRPITSHFQLHFNNELPETIFTGNIIVPKGNTPVQIFLTDTDKRTITFGTLSMLKVEILVLDGDISDEEQVNWAEEEFSKFVLRERNGRGPLLKGNQIITLKDGVGNLPSISFTDNSKWTRTQKFRLGARVFQNDLVQERIQEAISEAFSVNDHRGEYTMKHHTPSLEDKVWRLKNIRKDGPYHRRLEDHGIITVQDFLKFLAMDQNKLCSILFGEKMTNKKWNAIVEHARKCDLGPKLYSYIVPGAQVMLVFNSVLQVIGAGFGDSTWQTLDLLPKHQQKLVNRLKDDAYHNQNAIVEMNEPTDNHLEFLSAQLAAYIPESNASELHCNKVQINQEAKTDAWNSSAPVSIENSNLVEPQEQACFAMEGYKMDADLDGQACFTTKGCSMNGDFDQNTGCYETNSCSNMFMGQKISRRKWVKLKVTIKFGTSIRKCILPRRNARIQRVRWFRLLAAVRFGLSLRKLPAARFEDLPNIYHSPTGIDQHWNQLMTPEDIGQYCDPFCNLENLWDS